MVTSVFATVVTVRVCLLRRTQRGNAVVLWDTSGILDETSAFQVRFLIDYGKIRLYIYK